jgi:hypothetical protein
MNPDLKAWLETARKNLSPKARIRVREQILEHYNAALESYLQSGKTLESALALALADLGSAKDAAKKFEQVHLTNKEMTALLKAKTRADMNILLIFGVLSGVVALWNWFFLLKLSDEFSGNLFYAVLGSVQCLDGITRFYLARFGSLKQFAQFSAFVQPVLFAVLCTSLLIVDTASPHGQVLYIARSMMVVSFGLGIFLAGQTAFSTLKWRKLRSL